MAISFSSIAKKFIIGIAGIYGVYVLLIAALFIYSAIISHKVIEYDEEVKLHDGTMIWVHIKRHYRGTFGLKAYQRLGTTYRPREVEISWDTGFEGAGRKSVIFSYLVSIDRYDDFWYIGGVMEPNYIRTDDTIDCNRYGSFYERKCIIIIDKQGFLKKDLSKNPNIDKLRRNIFYPSSVKDPDYSNDDGLNGVKLDWDTKMKLQQYLTKSYADKPLDEHWLDGKPSIIKQERLNEHPNQ